MADFDMDQYLKEKSGGSPSAQPKTEDRPWYSISGEGLKQSFFPSASAPKFDMDKYLAEKGTAQPSAQAKPEDRPWYSMTAKGMKQGAMDAIPTVGMMAGGAMGGIPGAMAGSVAGESLRSTLNNDNPTRSEYYGRLVNAAKEGGLIEGGGKIASSVIGGAGKVAKGVASELSGISQKEIENYSSRADEINKLIKENQFDGKFDSQGAVNNMRDNVLGDVRSEIAKQNSNIQSALKGSSKIPIFSTQPIKSVLQSEIGKLDPVYQPGEIKAIQSIIDKIEQKAPETTAANIGPISLDLDALKNGKIRPGGPVSKKDIISEAERVYPESDGKTIPSWSDIGNKIKSTISDVFTGAQNTTPDALSRSVTAPGTNGALKVSQYHGYMNPQDAQVTKNFLYKIAKGSYPGDEFFQAGPKVANAAKKAGRAVKEMLDRSGPREIVEANNKLEQLHNIEDSLSGSVLDTNKPPTKMLSVGSGENVQDIKSLSDLGLLTGKDYIQNARDLSTARTFSNPKMFPLTNTGRSLYAPRVGGALGGAAGGALGAATGGPIGGMIGAGAGGAVGTGAGALISSPYAIKTAIDLSKSKVPAGLLSKVTAAGLLRRGLLDNK